MWQSPVGLSTTLKAQDWCAIVRATTLSQNLRPMICFTLCTYISTGGKPGASDGLKPIQTAHFEGMRPAGVKPCCLREMVELNKNAAHCSAQGIHAPYFQGQRDALEKQARRRLALLHGCNARRMVYSAHHHPRQFEVRQSHRRRPQHCVTHSSSFRGNELQA